MFKGPDLFEHMQRYTRDVFAERLRQEGFVSYKGQDIHWYRLVNKKVIQTVHFVAFHTAPCTFAEIKYGCHPLFVPPAFQKSPIMNGLPDGVQICDCVPETIPGSTEYGVERLLLYSEFNNRPYRVPDSLIMCSPDQNNGLDVLEKLLPVLDRTTTPQACYKSHKDFRQRFANPDFSITSNYFVEEVLYWQDEELYSCCREFVKRRAWCLENAIKKGIRLPKTYRREWEYGTVLHQVFETGKFEEYLLTFEDRIQKNLRLLQKNTGIQG